MRNSMRTGLLLLMTLLIYSGTMYAQKKVNEKCSKDDDCIGYCVTVEVRGVKKKICSDCNQSTINRYKRDISDYCKGLENKDGGWKPAKSDAYKAAVASDGRVNAGVYDVMIGKAKKCLEARKKRANECFDGGDRVHADVIKEIIKSRDNMISHKNTQIRSKRVFNGTKRVYDDLVNDFNTFCKSKINLVKFEQDLQIAEKAVDNESDEECENIMEYEDACYDCYTAAQNLFTKGFMSNKNKMPKDYLKTYEMIVELEETFEAVKNECE